MTWVETTVPNPTLSISQPDNNIVLYTGTDEMLKVTNDGFYIRGVKVPAGDKEASEVYECFKEWLNWATLTKRP
jgi:hypothetical protein